MVNPCTYTYFLVTEESFEDVDADPDGASVVAGAELVSPFGQ
jgi:hypothetical protein